MNDFHFLRPTLFWLIIPFLGLLFLLIRCNRDGSVWNKVCSKDLLPYILVRKAKSHFLSYFLILVTLILLMIALAGPTWQTIPQKLFKSKSGLVIALDLSPSMDAGDIKPSRLKRALYKINDLLNIRKEGQTALLVFSDNPFVVTPLTDDLGTIKALLPSLDTTIMPSAGHRVSKAISKAYDLLIQAGLSDGTILLITSELSSEELNKSMEFATQHGVKIAVLGVGTEESVPIPKPNGGFVTDSKGALVITTLANENLSRLAKSAHGKYVKISVDDSDLNTLNNLFTGGHQPDSQDEIQNAQAKWHDQGYLFVLLALPFVALLFRRGVAGVILLFIPQLLQASTSTSSSLWKTPDQEAEQCFHQENYQQAKELFQDPDWLGAAHYRLQDYEAAANLFEKNGTTEGLFNYATAKAKLGDFKKALEIYEEVLKKQPGHEDALYNKNLIEEFLKQQQQDQQNQSQDQDQKENQSNKNNQQDSGSEEKDHSESNSKDSQQNKDQDSQDSKQQDSQDSSDEKQKNNGKDQDVKESSSDTKDLQEQYRDQMNEKMQQQDQQPSDKENGKDKSEREEMTPEEQQRQMDDRWLQRIPDDPGGLLRRKFLYQYKNQIQEKNSGTVR